ncbi:hypothetical protein Anas_11487 [Armadillidium nasatum]|uniref:PiggyBac transposable element-derived protein domain-containing protein n=1 Tax=Armadillidium nasatum TaxID=96803 RepID=A0A5N5TLU9_9CRUS|nr:hypothetical protein Anas_11487 [Armadillidium nasatum]
MAQERKKTHVIGTLRTRKKNIPREVLDAKLRKGDIVSKEDENGIVVLKWKDQRDVRLLTTKHRTEMVETGSISSDIEEIDENQPDISDQMTSYNTPLRKALKWYRKLSFAVLLCLAVVNAWIVYNSIKGKKTQIKSFRESITRALLGVELPKRNPKPKCNLKHVLKYMLKDDGKRIRRVSKLCYEENKKKYGRVEARKKANKLPNFLI